MNLLRTRPAAVLCLVGLSLSSCLSAPEYPLEPSIDFKSLTMVRNIPSGANMTEIDTLTFALDFRDGDGDLGLSDADIKVSPYSDATGGFNNRSKTYNYSIQPYKRIGTAPPYSYTKFVLSVEGEYDGTYPHLEKEGSRPAPLKGTLTYALPVSVDGSAFNPGDTFRFEITIMDRALHKSNTVTTTDVTLKGPL